MIPTNALGIPTCALSSRTQRLSGLAQRLPAFPGKLRFGRQLLRGELTARNVIVRDAHGNRFVMPDLREPMAQHVLWNGVYEKDVLTMMRTHLAPAEYFVDVGANIGLFTVTVAQHLRRTGHVFAIEASPRLNHYLRANLALNTLDNVTVFDLAVADCAAESVAFYDAPPEKFGMGSLAPQFYAQPTFVPTRTLDDLLDPETAARVRVIKIDVEGFEEAVLRGSARLLQQTPSPLVVFEFLDWAEARAGNHSPGAAQNFLRALNYDIWRLDDWQRGVGPLTTVLTAGAAMLVAQRQVRA